MRILFLIGFFLVLICAVYKISTKNKSGYISFKTPVSYEDADKRAESILSHLSIEDKIELIGGYNTFFIKGFEKVGCPELYLSDATQGVHIRSELSNQLEQSTAFPCPICLAATWNPELAYQYATSIGEECRAGGIGVLLGPGLNIYRISQCGRNFEYFGEDPFLAARIIEQYVIGIQNCGVIATLKHFVCNNTDFRRRISNSVVDERTLHEIYLPAFKAGIDAGAMAVMTAYNQVNGEWSGQSNYVINQLVRKDLGFKWLVMSDWWSVWDPVKAMHSGLDLEMPGYPSDEIRTVFELSDPTLKSNALRLLKEGRISEEDIQRMAKSIIRTTVAMGFHEKPLQDDIYLNKISEHENIALQTAREGIVLLKNMNGLLPIDPEMKKKILVTGDFVKELARGGGSADVEGYNLLTMLDALKDEFGDQIEYQESPSDRSIKSADIVLLSIGTPDHEGWDRSFALSEALDRKICNLAENNSNIVVIVNSGGGVQMTQWVEKVAALIYGWYPGQIGNRALAEILSGKVNPSGKLPITIEKKFEDSPGYSYLPEGESLYTGWDGDKDMTLSIHDIYYDEGVFVGYRWYESKKIEPLFPFGFGLSYTTFEYSDIQVSDIRLRKGVRLKVQFTLTNTGKVSGAEIAQLYVQDVKASVPRPVKELKGFQKVFLNPGERKKLKLFLDEKDFSFYNIKKKEWFAEPGDFSILVGAASNDIRLSILITLIE